MNLGFIYLLLVLLVLMILIFVSLFLKQMDEKKDSEKPKPPALQPKNPCPPYFWGNVENPLNCSLFYMCVSGTPIARECTSGAFFSVVYNSCRIARTDEEIAIMCGNRPI
ncbi:XcGVORF20-like protein [Hyphantria cunea granulovirus]|uniref:XcGVORF20-like protein n=1 Tax=Hyphantria cunea granulovirus TaxID=307448 RepID=A0AAE6D055_9BBAC|nr:XcGVORF20-like protein [Hyphantria cunea granulovirus]QBQ01667.1 XcGVORF20-like protein [Hyphantria cunea granulovirus]